MRTLSLPDTQSADIVVFADRGSHRLEPSRRVLRVNRLARFRRMTLEASRGLVIDRWRSVNHERQVDNGEATVQTCCRPMAFRFHPLLFILCAFLSSYLAMRVDDRVEVCHSLVAYISRA